MKKTLKIAILSCCCALGLLQNGKTQVAAISLGEGGRMPSTASCNGGGLFCLEEIKILPTNSAEMEIMAAKNTGNIYFANAQNLVIQFLKKTMPKEKEFTNFQQKNVYFIEKDTDLDPALCAVLNKESIKIKQGMYPIIEWEDSYFVSFQIEEK